MIVDYPHQKVSTLVTSRAAKRLTTQKLRNLEKFMKIPDMFGIDGKYSVDHSKPKFLQLC